MQKYRSKKSNSYSTLKFHEKYPMTFIDYLKVSIGIGPSIIT